MEIYQGEFQQYICKVQAFLSKTEDLHHLEKNALEILCDTDQLEIFRYLPGPPISVDDLKVLARADSVAPSRLKNDSDLVNRILGVVQDCHDRLRFPWVFDKRRPTAPERESAVLSTAALLTMRKVETLRRKDGKTRQESRVRSYLSRQFIEVDPRSVKTLSDAPKRGEFCGESVLGTRKADFLVGLRDGRLMPIECKVSNSSINSVKRLNNDAAVKAEVWRSDFGAVQVVPTAVLSGVYKLHNLEDAQRRGLTLFWSHDLQSMLEWMRDDHLL